MDGFWTIQNWGFIIGFTALWEFNQQKHWGLNQQKIVCKGLQGYHKSIARMSPTRIIVSDVGLTNTSKRNVNQLNYYI
jgi:hypothetical protein